ncbi:MAG: LuxR family transcriptional regulator, partial [Ktedonobacteraceae bacterium]|nr:LuxR family transcriptional regulator [Ktedonobacteraceae bacterium]
MPRVPLHALIWSQDQSLYELYIQGHLAQRFLLADEEAWLAWLAQESSLAFQGASGRLNVYKEARSRGGEYWYAYHTTKGRTRKHYLGRTAVVTFIRLEEVALALSCEPSPPSLMSLQTQREADVGFPGTSRKAEQGMTLLSTKLSHPRLPISLVEREHLLADLDGALSTPLTLLSASAGWGKTTLLSIWASRHPHQVAWLSLDGLDNDLTRFWAAGIAALRTCMPGVGTVALAMLHSPQPPPFSAIFTSLFNELAEVGEQISPMLLLLDDYQVIIDTDIHESLLFWLEHLPAHIHLLISSRVDPELPLSRLRVRGQLLEIRAADLRFTREDVSTFLRHAMGLSLSEEEVAALHKRTEGWVAGLQLAALSLRTQQDRSAWIAAFSGSHRYLLDYVQQEILMLQPLPIQRFLLQVAVLTRMNASLCQAVTGELASQDVLETLERTNLFVVPLDEQRRWYRLHDLFREALLARLHATQPELLPHLHQRAAQWYEAQGEAQEAIAHLLEACDFSSAAALMEREAERVWLNGEVKTLYRWVMALSDPMVGEHARLVLTAALYLLNAAASTIQRQQVRAQKEAEQMMARVEAALGYQGNNVKAQPETEKALKGTERALLQQRLRLLRAWSAAFETTMVGDRERLRIIEQRMQNLDREDEVVWQMIPLSITFVVRYSLEQEGASLVPLFQGAKQWVIQSGDHFAIIKVMQWLALSYLRAGQLRLAHQECVAALDLITQIDGHAILAGYFYFCLARIFYQWNQLEEAQSTLRKMIHDAHAWQQVDLQVVGYLFLVEAELSASNLSCAQQALQQAEALVQQEQFAIQAFGVVAAQVQYWLAAGNLDAARNWAQDMVFSPETWNPNCQGAL